MKDWGAGAKYLQILSLLPKIWMTSERVSEKDCSHYLKREWFFSQKKKIKLPEQTSQKTSLMHWKSVTDLATCWNSPFS